MKLYKYYSFTDYNLEALEKRSFWISNIADFNDPFEFKVLRPEDCSQVEGIKEMREQNRHLDHLDDVEFCELYLNQYQNHFTEWGSSCFSEDPLNLLMWAHYANCHTGFCLEFSFEWGRETHRGEREGFFPVIYADKYPPFHFCE